MIFRSTLRRQRPRHTATARQFAFHPAAGLLIAAMALAHLPPMAVAEVTIGVDTTQNGGVLTLSPPGALLVTHPTNNPLLTLTNGATTSGIEAVIIANLATREGNLLVNGGSVLSTSGTDLLGTYGTTDVYRGNSYLGLNAGSSGAATISGAGSQWHNSGVLHEGLNGIGTLQIENGGTATNFLGLVGYNAGSMGVATVTGAGSQWISSYLAVGDAGQGTLNVENGGLVSSTGSYLAYFSGSSGTVSVTGTGSKWQSSEYLLVGGSINGTGTVDIANGGEVSVGGTTKLFNNGTVNLRPGGTLDVNYYYDFSLGTFNFTGGTLDADGNVVGSVVVPNGGLVAGTGDYSNSMVVNAGGVVAPGNSPGTMSIAGDLTNAGTLQFELAGLDSTEHDQLNLTGLFSAGGMIDIDLLGGFSPAYGATFDLMDFTSFSDNGHSFDFSDAPLAPGLSWDTSQFSSTGAITVVPEPSTFVLAVLGFGIAILLRRKRGAPVALVIAAEQ